MLSYRFYFSSNRRVVVHRDHQVCQAVEMVAAVPPVKRKFLKILVTSKDRMECSSLSLNPMVHLNMDKDMVSFH